MAGAEQPVDQPAVYLSHNISPPQPLDLRNSGEAAENFNLWKEKYNNYFIISRLENESPAFQLAMFKHSVGDEALKVIKTFGFNEHENSGDWKVVMAKLEAHCIGKVNETFERYVFNKRDKLQGESIDSYVAELKTLAKTCNFCNCLRDSLIRDRVVLGIKNEQTTKKLLRMRDLTLSKCIDTCRSEEITEMQMKSMSETSNDYANKIKAQRRQQYKESESDGSEDDERKTKQVEKKISCKFCGFEHFPDKQKCPAWGKTCNKCKRKNHFAKRCRKSSIYCIESEEEEISVVRIQAMKEKAVFAKMLVNDVHVNFQVDCGASANILPYKYVEKEHISPCDRTLVMWNGTKVKPLGTHVARVVNLRNQKKYDVKFLIVKDDLTPLLGLKTTEEMRLLTIHKENFISNVFCTKTEVVDKHDEIFNDDLGRLPGIVHLEVDPNHQPVVLPARKIPVSVRDQFKVELQRLERLGVITPVEEPTEWVSQIVVAVKTSGALRVCIDPKPLNEALKRERYQIPVIDDLLPDLSEARVFSRVDLASAFWHLELDEESSKLTTFSTPYGRFRWLRLPFGLNVSSEIFQKRLNQELLGLEGVKCIADDILIFGANEKDHDQNFERLLERCKEKGIKLTKDKLEFKCKEVSFHGHLLTNEGLKVDPGKVKAIMEMPRPTTPEEILRLNGMVNYLSRFLPNLSEVMKPLRDLTHKESAWCWLEIHEKAWNEVKHLIATTPVLAYYKPSKKS